MWFMRAFSSETQRLARSRGGWRRLGVSLGAGLGAGLLVCVLHALNLFEGLEQESYDIRVRTMADPATARKDIVMVMIGQESIDYYARNDPVSGAWPWTRDYYDPVVKHCRAGGARAVVFDMIFTEQSRVAEHDAHLGETCRRPAGGAGVFMVAAFDPAPGDPVEIPARFRVPLRTEGGARIPEFHSVHLPFGPLRDGIAGIGDAYVHQEGDAGKGRLMPLLCRYRDGVYPSLAFAAWLETVFPGYFELPAERRPVLTLDRRNRLVVPAATPLKIPLDAEGRMLVRFRGPEWYPPNAPPEARTRTYARHEIADVITSWDAREAHAKGETAPAERVPAESFRDKIVIVGADAPGLDTKAGPFGIWAGPLAHVAALDTLLQGDFLVRLRWRRGPTVLTLLGLSLAVTLLAGSRSALLGAAASGVLLAGYAVFAFVAWRSLHAWIELVAPLCAGLLAYGAAATANYFLEGKDKLFLKHAFQHFVPAPVVQKILAHPEALKLGGEKRDLTIFFSDLAGFTSLSEVMKPEDLFGTLNEYLDRMTEVIFEHHGTLDKYVGDAIVAFWNAPERREDHAVMACRAALANQKELQTFRAKLKMAGLPDFNARIGLNTGAVTVGFVGARKRFQYTVLGDDANLASRLEGANKAYGTSILISETTYAAAHAAIVAREVDLLRVKGKLKPVRVYELMGLAGETGDDAGKIAAVFQEGLFFYRDRKWAEAKARFETVLGMAPGDGPAKTYIERCDHYAHEPPSPDWDGVYVMKTK